MKRRTALKLLFGGALASLELPNFLRATAIGATATTGGDNPSKDRGMVSVEKPDADASHTDHPDAQWYPKAGFGLFLHWGICSVRAMNISWPMIPGRPLAERKLEDDELARVIDQHDWNLDGKPPAITPNEYWTMAKDFNPQNYDPDKWCKAAKDAGFVYVVLTTKHHEGFAQWPTAYGDFNTKTYMGGRDLVKDYVESCRKNGLKVGLYYSGPDWHFDRDYMTFLYHGAYKKNPGLPQLDANLMPRDGKKDKADVAQHQKESSALVRGQVEELLTNYGKIDLLWFDGKPAVPNPSDVIPMSRIRELQPGVVVNGRLHGHGDFFTYERTMPVKKTAPGWAELCNTWTNSWPYVAGEPYRSDAFSLGQLATCRSLGINYLLGTGPMSSGELAADAYKNMAVVGDWMKQNGVAVHDVDPLPAGESASVPAVASGSTRYLYAIRSFDKRGSYDAYMTPAEDQTLTLKGAAKPESVTLLGDGSALSHDFADGTITMQLPAAKRTKLLDVVCVQLPKGT
jgi:alpha-L-fucosidase